MKKAGGLDESREPVILAFLEICVSSRPYIRPSARADGAGKRRGGPKQPAIDAGTTGNGESSDCIWGTRQWRAPKPIAVAC